MRIRFFGSNQPGSSEGEPEVPCNARSPRPPEEYGLERPWIKVLGVLVDLPDATGCPFRCDGPSATRLDSAFGDVGVAVDHLKVRQAPKIEQLGPRLVSVFAPDPEQWDPMVNFRVPP
jgi:hypothetical protein